MLSGKSIPKPQVVRSIAAGSAKGAVVGVQPGVVNVVSTSNDNVDT